LALDAKTHRLFCAGTNGKLAVLDSLTGQVLSSVTIASGVDQIAFDAELKRVYCASRNGVISVLEETGEGASPLGDIKTAPGAKTIAVDAKTHAVWVAYADKDKSYLLRLTVP
jgi:DNA-binding beta-propeller fold protein YncE